MLIVKVEHLYEVEADANERLKKFQLDQLFFRVGIKPIKGNNGREIRTYWRVAGFSTKRLYDVKTIHSGAVEIEIETDGTYKLMEPTKQSISEELGIRIETPELASV